MKRYKVTLLADERDERDELVGIAHKGSHQSQKVINALILLNCDEGEFNALHLGGAEVANIWISMRKVDRIKKCFVEEGLDTTLGRKPSSHNYGRIADGGVDAHLRPELWRTARWSLRLLADRAVEFGYADSISYETVWRVLKKRNQTVAEGWLGNSSRSQHRICRRDGTGSRCLPPTL